MTQNDKKHTSFKSFLASVWWILSFNFRVLPGATIIRLFNKTAANFTPILNAYIIAWIVDYLTKSTQTNSINTPTLLLLLGVFLTVALVTSFLSDLNFFVDIVNRIKLFQAYYKELYKKIGTLNMEEIENSIFSDKLYRAKESINDYAEITNQLLEIIPTIIKTIILLLVVGSVLPIPIILLTLLIIPRYLTQAKMLRELHHYNVAHTQEKRLSEDNLSVVFNTQYLHEVKLQNSYEYFGNKYFLYQQNYYKEYITMNGKRYLTSYGFSVLNYIVIGIGIWLLGMQLSQHNITVGIFTFHLSNIINYAQSLAASLLMTTGIYERFIKLQDFRDIITYQKKLPDGREVLHLDESPEIVFDHVTFSYPNSQKVIIDDLSLTIKPGERIAIVGENGTGKTTLVRLLLRLYQPQRGEIKINDINLKEITLDSWFDHIGALFQEYNMYPHLTVAENIRVGDLKKTDNPIQISRALEQADALGFVSHYQKGIHQLLSEKYTDGIRPSTGQWQKIAIARFMFRNPKVAIFDEPTASIDAVSEAKIFDSIFTELKGKTVIIISHRFSTVRNADRIIVLKDGHIAEQGNHEELIKMDGIYASSFKLQARGYAT